MPSTSNINRIVWYETFYKQKKHDEADKIDWILNIWNAKNSKNVLNWIGNSISTVLYSSGHTKLLFKPISILFVESVQSTLSKPCYRWYKIMTYHHHTLTIAFSYFDKNIRFNCHADKIPANWIFFVL